MSNVFADKAFDVEHALSMYAASFVTMPAFAIYEDEQIAPLMEQIRRCHIYIIGLVPKLDLVGVTQEGRDLITSLQVGVKRYGVRWHLPDGVSLKGDDKNGWHLEDATGAKSLPSEARIRPMLGWNLFATRVGPRSLTMWLCMRSRT